MPVLVSNHSSSYLWLCQLMSVPRTFLVSNYASLYYSSYFKPAITSYYPFFTYLTSSYLSHQFVLVPWVLTSPISYLQISPARTSPTISYQSLQIFTDLNNSSQSHQFFTDLTSSYQSNQFLPVPPALTSPISYLLTSPVLDSPTSSYQSH
jgi:hypothetical protein